VDGRDTLFPIFKHMGKKSNMFDFLPVLPEFLAILLPAVLTFRSPLLLKNEQQPISEMMPADDGYEPEQAQVSDNEYHDDSTTWRPLVNVLKW
jgi:hypothetical protein